GHAGGVVGQVSGHRDGSLISCRFRAERKRPLGKVERFSTVRRRVYAWRRLEDLFATLTMPRVRLVPVTDDAAKLYETWVGWGGEGIVLKEPRSIYRRGIRSPAWLKVKPKVTLEVMVTGGSSGPITWGDWGLAVMLDIAYKHPRDGKFVEIRQAIRVR